MKVLDSQVGGSHYKCLPYQPVEFCARTQMNFIQGSIIKYVSRHRQKNGLQDLQKALHFAELAIELKPKGHQLRIPEQAQVKLFLDMNKNFLTFDERILIKAVTLQDWSTAIMLIKEISKQYESKGI